MSLYADDRVGGKRRWFYGDPRRALMRVPDLVAHNPVFLGVKKDGAVLMAGTGFFIGVHMPETNQTFGYLVTARHCVEKAKQYGSLYLRINTREGTGSISEIGSDGFAQQASDAELIELQDAEWLYHEDVANDVAVLPLMPPQQDFVFIVAQPEFCVTPEVLESERIGIGDELVAPGLFTSHYGRTSNRPILRSGIIAAMPDEPLIDRDSGLSYDAYLAEIRSVGGLSGSPVWVVINPARVRPGNKPGEATRETRLFFYLLGLIRGHWQKQEDWISDFGESEAEALNTGIAIVKPITKALDIINSEALVAKRQEDAREFEKNKLEGKQVEDSPLDGESEFERFEDLTRKLVNTPKPEKDES